MRITKDDTDLGKYVISLNNRLVRYAVAADEEEGWVDVANPGAIAPPVFTGTKEEWDRLHKEGKKNKRVLSERDMFFSDQPSHGNMPTKRLYGTVKIRTV